MHKGDNPEEAMKREGRFMREVTLLARVQHKNLVMFTGACKEPVIVVVTELLLGGSLCKYLINMRPRKLELRVAVAFALDIARAMECLHSHGIIHRDLKPGMSNLQAAYAAAFKNFRPSADDLPEELVLILTSCWQEDPNSRPNFSQIVQMLLHYLSTLSPPEHVVPSHAFCSENVVLPPESPGTSSLMAARDETDDTAKDTRDSKGFSCFGQCF